MTKKRWQDTGKADIMNISEKKPDKPMIIYHDHWGFCARKSASELPKGDT